MNSKLHCVLFVFALALLSSFSSCKIKYKFSGASIDYATTTTFSIVDFDNQAALVYPPAAQQFTEALRRKYVRETRLREVTTGGDFDLSGSIVGYDLAPVAVQEDAFASMTRFTLTIRVNFENRTNSKKNFTRTFSAFADFDSSSLFPDVQDGLLKELTDEIVKQIFNATAEDW